MLNAYETNRAKTYARELADEGMIWGKELENYIKNDAAYLSLKLSEEKLESYIEFVIYWVENIYSKAVVVYDLIENESTIYTTIKEASENIEATLYSLYISIERNSFIKKRYCVSRYKPKISELNQGISSINKKKIKMGR